MEEKLVQECNRIIKVMLDIESDGKSTLENNAFLRGWFDDLNVLIGLLNKFGTHCYEFDENGVHMFDLD